MLNFILPILLTLNPTDTTKVKVNVTNVQHIQTIGGRDVTFGVKETVEELLIEKGYTPVDSGIAFDVQVSIDSIYSPQQILNIMGVKWLRKDYIVETSTCIGSGCFKGKGERRTFIFAMFLEVEGNEIPLNRKAFSKALESSLKETVKFKTKQ
jgi:hypothetical protein